ncbi:MAG: ABC transporter transmembrane domain-containing protein, partial [Polyangia bacterium]
MTAPAPANAGSTEPSRADGVRAALQPVGPRMGGRIEKPKDAGATFRRLWLQFRPFRGRLALVTAAVVLYTLLGLCGPYLMGQAIDRFIVLKNADGLARIAVLMLGAYVLGNLVQLFSNRLMAVLSQRVLRDLRGRLFQHLQTLPVAFFDRQPAGDLMSRLTNDVEAINQAVAQNITALLASVLSMVGILVAMFVLDRWLALAALVVVPVMFWFTRFVAV